MTITASPACIAFIKAQEGCRLTSYKCPAGVWTIGYGATSDVREGMTITQDEADAFLRTDMQIVAQELATLTAAELSPGQADALISFGFNCGFHQCPTLRGHLKAGRLDKIPGEMLRFTRGGGKVLPGLVARRHAEVAMFLADGAPMPQAVTALTGLDYAAERAAAPSWSVRSFLGAGLAGVASLYSSGLDAIAKAAGEAAGVYSQLSTLHLSSSRIAVGVGIVCLGVAFVRQLLPRSTP